MSKMTKKDRNKIYTKALEFLKEENESIHRGLCWAICEVFELSCIKGNEIPKSIVYPYGGGIMKYPELVKHCSDKYEEGWWFEDTLEGRAKRISILEEAIELTNSNNHDNT